ncbi:MAG: RNA polymerase sigma factor RpoE [Gammaproteobacteria bacterium]|nr:RNA polymerase sigma factor RpoE [Gammaproteobacteria bacterium]
MSDNVSDRDLVERVQGGERRAFDLLMLKYQHRIAKLIARYVQDPSEVLDVAQDAFMKAYRAIPRFRGDSAFYTWMYRIAINTAKNHLAAKARRPRDSGVDVTDAEQFDGVAELKESVTPEGLALTEEIQQTVAAAIEALPEDLRVAISLRELEGFSYEDIARVMECPIGTVRSRIFRAREAINARLDPLLD